MDVTSFSFDTAFVFLINVIFAVAALGLIMFCFLQFRQVQMMNSVLRTRLGGMFVMIAFVILLASLGLFGLLLLNIFV
jgi:hypothetical protein